jgi:Mg2+-importing ATPase
MPLTVLSTPNLAFDGRLTGVVGGGIIGSAYSPKEHVMSPNLSNFWSLPVEELLRQLETSDAGLAADEAQHRLARFGPNSLKPAARTTTLALLLAQFTSPIILILLFAAVLSAFLGDPTDAIIILLIVLASGLLGFWQERGAADAVAKLLAMVQIKATARRGGTEQEIPVEAIVPGDIVLLKAGDTIPGDSRLLASKDLFVDEAALTGETFPVEAKPGILPANTPLAQRTNILYLGTHVVSGTGIAVVAHTGRDTEFGQVSERLKTHKPETEFEHGIRQFGFFLMQVTLLLVIAIFAINVYFQRPVLDSLLFALALAVGLTPQLLPAIISINLARGAKRMADARVIVKRLAAIENFGSMNVLCSDKTGTLTEGTVRLHAVVDAAGQPSDKAMLYAYLNASYESGFVNPIDQAIRSQNPPDVAGFRKLDEVPYDFLRKRLSILVARDSAHLLITKGAVTNVLDVCTDVENASGAREELVAWRERIEKCYQENSRQGYRGLGIAYREMDGASAATKDQEADMTFLGFLFLFDPPKPGIIETIRELKRLGIALKIITGDNHLVAANVAEQVGLAPSPLLTGPEIHKMSSEALTQRVQTQRSSQIKRSACSWLCTRRATSSAILATASTMARRCMRPMSASLWTARWMWRKRRRTLCFWSMTSAYWCRGCAKGGSPLRIHSNTSLWRPVRISAICSAWRGHHCSCHFCHCCRSKFS